jgi:hypothetical protein
VDPRKKKSHPCALSMHVVLGKSSPEDGAICGAGKVRHIRRPGPMWTVTIKLTIEGLVGELFVVLHPKSLAVPTDTKVSIDTIVR